MNVLSIESVSKTYGYKPLLEGVTFGLDAGEKVGVIGANGSGKSTLLRLIAGEESPDAGRAVVSRSVTIGYLAQNPRFDEGRSVLDAVFPPESPEMRLLNGYERACRELAGSEGADERLLERVAALTEEIGMAGGWDLEANARVVLTQLGVADTRAAVGALSGGMRKRVALARALVSRPDLLILDEPTNHLDVDAIEWLEGYLAEFRGAVVLVTHDRYFLDRVTGRILEVEGGRVQSFGGSYAYYLEKKAEMESARAKADRRRETEFRRELAWLERGARARTTKEKARVQRVEALRAAPRESRQRDVEISVAAQRLGTKVLELEAVSKAYGETRVVAGFSYTLKRRDRIAFVGPNGVGKTTLLDIIAGRAAPDGGAVTHGQTVVVGYFDQEILDFDPDERAIDYVTRGGGEVRTGAGEVASAGQMLERFLFPPDVHYAPVGTFSGGERRRLFLLKVLMAAPNVLLLDEPTNDLDIATLVRLEEYLDSFEGAVVVVSHDRYFLDRTVEHVFVFEGDGRIRGHAGNYSAYREARERAAAAPRAAAGGGDRPAAPRRVESDAPRRLSFNEQRELAELEARIEGDEARRAVLASEMAAAASDYQRLHAIGEEIRAIDERLERDLARWGELAELA